MKNLDTYSSLSLVLLAFGVCFFSIKLSLWTSNGPSDGFFPFLGGLILGVLGLCLLVQSLFKPRKTYEAREPILKVKLLTYTVLILLYPLVLELLGFLLTTFFFFLFVFKGAEKASWKISLIISVLSTLGCVLIFVYLLDIPFPTGFLKGLTLFA